MTKMPEIIERYFKEHDELMNVEFLRYVVRFIDNRPEYLNENKTLAQLINEALRNLDAKEEQ